MKKLRNVLFALVALYAVFGFVVLPYVVKPKIVEAANESLNAKLHIDSLSFNPFSFTAELQGITLADLKQTTLLQLHSLYLNVDPYALIYGAVAIKTIRFDEPELFVQLNQDKSLNFLNIIKEHKEPKTQKEETNAAIPRVLVGEFVLHDGQVHYDDFSQPTPFHFTFERIDFILNDIDTKDFNSSDAHLGVYSNLGDGAFLRIENQIDGFKPFAIHGQIDFQANQLYTEWRYIKDSVNFEVADGKASLSAKYALSFDKLDELSIYDAVFMLDKLRIKPKDDAHDIVNLENLRVNVASVLPLRQQLHVTNVALDGLKVKASRDKKGKINLVEHFASSATKESETNTSVSVQNKELTPWRVAVDQIALKNIAADFDDNALSPHVLSKVNKLDIKINDFQLHSQKPFDYTLQADLNEGVTCNAVGSVIQKQLHLHTNVTCNDFDLTRYNPYINQAAKKALKRFDLKLSSLKADANLTLDLKEQNGSMNVTLQESSVKLRDLKLYKRSTRERLGVFDMYAMDGVAFDLQQNLLVIDKVTLEGLGIYPKIYKDKTINFANIIVPKRSKNTKAKKSQAKPLQAHINSFELKNAHVVLQDRSLDERATNKISNINVTLKDIDTKKGTWLAYKASMRINKKGKLYTHGKLRHTPLREYGTFTLKNVALKDINPYIHQYTYTTIKDGRISMRAKTTYAKSSKKPDFQMKGNFALNSLFINNTLDDSSLFSMNLMDMNNFTFELAPDRFYADEVDLDGFYVDAVVDQNKTINFAKLLKRDAKVTQESVQNDTNTTNKPAKPFDAKIVKLNVSNGSAKFADHSIPIDFQTDIHDLNGVVYVISTIPGETTYINIDGEVDKYGSAKLKGSVDSSNPKLFTDLSLTFKNLDLSSMSGYSANFAGYKIDSGKLFLDLKYDISNSQLNASNNVVINKIVLGDAIEDENVTHLPLGFVFGLLEDSDGIIDIDLPIEGNLDEPDFKYGALVLKTIGNLITKAVTAPFSFLGSMMGLDAEELSFVSFEPGKALITPPEREKLDKIAKIMQKRPKVELKVAAVYDKNIDLLALKRAKLITKVLEKSGQKDINEHENILTKDMLEDIYKEMQADDKLELLEEKLEKEYENEDQRENAYKQELLHLTTQIQHVTRQELQQLAHQRQQAIITYLTGAKELNPQRIIKAEVSEIDTAKDDVINNNLQIKVK